MECYIARASTFHWRTLSRNIIGSWERTAVYLNTLPVPGLLSTCPHVNLPCLELETIVMTVLLVDWQSICTSICSSIKQVYQTESNKVVVLEMK